jgi:hypothetical protein
MKNLARVTVLAVAASLLLAVGASSAMAEVVSAKFSSTGSTKVPTANLTVKKNGIEPKTCNLPVAATGGGTSGSELYAWNNEVTALMEFSCGGSLSFSLALRPATGAYDTVAAAYKMWIYPNPGCCATLKSPWGAYAGGSPFLTGWTNGSGATQSTLTFNENVVGTIGSAKITISGSITVTTGTGGLLTLIH